MAALWLAEKAGIKMQQVPVGAGALIPSLRSGQVDAIAFSSLITQREIMTGNARLLMSIGDQMEPTLSDVYTASQKMIDERPQELRATLAAISKGLAHMRGNREWALAFLKEFAKADNDELNKLLYDDVVPKLSVDGKIERKWVEDGLKLAARAWDMPDLGKVDPDSLFTNDFIPTVK
jgi:ABC-type nitrate/sulfonate/bicarbonate transport system substrate-binding protein